MKDLWIPINIPNFEEIQKELLNMITIEPNVTKTHAVSIDEAIMMEKCPLFMSWLIPRKKQTVRMYRFYITEPYGHLGAHIDGGKNLKVPFGMNIPVLNCQNTFHIFYDCDEDNIKSDFNKGYLGGCVPIDRSLIKEKTRLEITRPYFTRNDVLHSIENNNPTYRIMFTVRWALHPTKARNIDEVFDFGI
jgi:hypothetical protein